MKDKLIPLDFEYRGTSERKLDLICVAFEVEGELVEYWLRTEEEKLKCKEHLKRLRDTGYIFVCFNGIAEGHAFISLNLNPAKALWIDIQAEYKMVTNHNHNYMYGKHLLDGQKVFTVAPKYGADKTVNNARPKHNLAAGVYKLLDIEIDTDHKEEMRQICIHGTPEELEANRVDIQNYCSSDIQYLKAMWFKIREIYKDYAFARTFKDFINDKTTTIDHKVSWDEVLWRGETMARTALMTSEGYPVNAKQMKTFSKNVSLILKELCEDINSQFDYDLFNWNNKDQRYSKNTKLMKEIISESEYKDRWMKTPPSKRFPDGSYSLKLDAFEQNFSYSHDYPRGNPFAQYLRYLKTQRSLNGFIPKGADAKDKTTIFDSLGSDERVRGYLNPYGSQSSRYQPKATSFIPLKSAWLRSLITPKRGRAITGIDFKSEEFLIGGLVSGDKNMLAAYKSGDVYLYFAKLAGAVPMDGTKAEYKKERDLFKSTTLGISYLMGPEALGRKLTADTGVLKTTNDAKELIKKFTNAYPDYAAWQDQAYFTYRAMQSLKLADGWIMFGDNDNERSVKNCPIQGMGGAILRKCVQLAQDRGLRVIFTLHDALYIEHDSNDLSKIDDLLDCMREGFAYYFKGDLHKQATELIQFDVDLWGPDYPDEVVMVKTPKGKECKRQKIYIDERAKSEYERFKKYM